MCHNISFFHIEHTVRSHRQTYSHSKHKRVAYCIQKLLQSESKAVGLEIEYLGYFIMGDLELGEVCRVAFWVLFRHTKRRQTVEFLEDGGPGVLRGAWSGSSVGWLFCGVGWEVWHGYFLLFMQLFVMDQGWRYIRWVKCCNADTENRRSTVVMDIV